MNKGPFRSRVSAWLDEHLIEIIAAVAVAYLVYLLSGEFIDGLP